MMDPMPKGMLDISPVGLTTQLVYISSNMLARVSKTGKKDRILFLKIMEVTPKVNVRT